jgi:hypothetical protein
VNECSLDTYHRPSCRQAITTVPSNSNSANQGGSSGKAETLITL